MFLRGLGLVYLAAFASMAVQVDGLIGSHGILPAADYLEQARQSARAGAGDVLAAADLALAERVRSMRCTRLCWGGLRRSAAHFSPGSCPGSVRVLALGLLPFDRGGRQVFLGYQWDALLLEAGLLAVLHGTLGTLGWARAGDEPWSFADLAGALAGLSPDVPVGHGQAGEPRPGLVELEGARFSL